jgi:hypothetical protein
VNTFTIKLTRAQARRLRLVAGKEGATPEAFIADAAVAHAYIPLASNRITDEQSDQERARAAELNAAPA